MGVGFFLSSTGADGDLASPGSTTHGSPFNGGERLGVKGEKVLFS